MAGTRETGRQNLERATSTSPGTASGPGRRSPVCRGQMLPHIQCTCEGRALSASTAVQLTPRSSARRAADGQGTAHGNKMGARTCASMHDRFPCPSCNTPKTTTPEPTGAPRTPTNVCSVPQATIHSPPPLPLPSPPRFGAVNGANIEGSSCRGRGAREEEEDRIAPSATAVPTVCPLPFLPNCPHVSSPQPHKRPSAPILAPTRAGRAQVTRWHPPNDHGMATTIRELTRVAGRRAMFVARTHRQR